MFWQIIKILHAYFLCKKVMSAIARLGHLKRMVTELIMLAELKMKNE